MSLRGPSLLVLIWRSSILSRACKSGKQTLNRELRPRLVLIHLQEPCIGGVRGYHVFAATGVICSHSEMSLYVRLVVESRRLVAEDLGDVL